MPAGLLGGVILPRWHSANSTQTDSKIMAGDWLKFEKATMDKPEVFEMAGILGIDPDAVVGKLLRVWSWFDEQSRDGHASVTVRALLERRAGVPDFVSAMIAVGWLAESNGRFILPNYDRHNGSSAKSRALATVRKQKSRNCHAPSVTKTEQTRDHRIEEREKNKNIDPESSPCSVEQAIAYASMVRMTPDQARHWWNVRNASGWTKGSTGGGTPRRITSWQSDMATSLSWVAESIQKEQGVRKGRIVPDIGGRKPREVLDPRNFPTGVYDPKDDENNF